MVLRNCIQKWKLKKAELKQKPNPNTPSCSIDARREDNIPVLSSHFLLVSPCVVGYSILLLKHCRLVMLKNQKKIWNWYVSIPESILVPYNITIKEIWYKLKTFFERSVRKILKTWIRDFWNILIMTLWNLQGKFGSHFRNRYRGGNTNWFKR